MAEQNWQSQLVQWAEVDEQGRLVLPPQVAAQYGLQPGARMRVEPDGNHLRLHRPVTHLLKIYVEPTNRCNLNCSMCIRNNWQEQLGNMTSDTFERLLENVRSLPKPITVFFGGLGEPLFHPKTIEWVAQAKEAGATVELITNGTTLNEKRARALIASGLDVLWVSLDGATPESYADVRLGAKLPRVLDNVARFRKLRRGSHHARPVIGIAFVAMQRNVHEFGDVLRLGRKLGAKRFMVSNVLPYTEEMQAESLYQHTLRSMAYLDSPWLPKLSLPKMDLQGPAGQALLEAFNSGYNVEFAGNRMSGANDVCNFIESGSISVRWDGAVAPCWALLHNHDRFMHGKPHKSYEHIVGDINQQDLIEMWMDPAYIAYRERVQSFGFAPCTYCGGCDESEANLEDCLGNEFPVCGVCLWAQGVIQCP